MIYSDPTIQVIEASQAILTYVGVEANRLIITRNGGYQPGCTKAPPIHQRPAGNMVLRLNRVSATEQADDDYGGTQEYSKVSGVEHIRRECPRVGIEIYGSSLKVLLDTGAELNTMRLKTAEAAGLQVTSMPFVMKEARLMTANGSREEFAGIVWRVPVQISQVKVVTNFFVTKALSYPAILGTPFLSDSRASIRYDTDGRTVCTLTAEHGGYQTRFVATQSDPINPRGMFVGDELGKVNGVQRSGL